MNGLSFTERQSRAIRLWHWLTVIATGLLLFTVLVSKTFLNGMHAGQTIEQATSKFGAKLSREQVGRTVSALRSSIWKWHIYFGYALSILLGFRLLIELFSGKLLKSFRKGFSFLKFRQQKRTAIHYLVVKTIYVLFYAMLGTIVYTGLWMAYYRNSDAVRFESFHDVKEIHENCLILLLLFIFIHLIGIIKAERGKHKNIVSGMIHGQKSSG
jgi:Ni/Fe-hydrogenase 1 B-type cytochrome subunit